MDRLWSYIPLNWSVQKETIRSFWTTLEARRPTLERIRGRLLRLQRFSVCCLVTLP